MIPKKVKEQAALMVVVSGVAIAGMIFWELIRAFMWACYYAGIPM